MRYKYHVLLGFFILSLVVSLILSLRPVSEVCVLKIGCDIVHSSYYNYFFGIKNSYFGIPIFAIGSWLIFLQIKQRIKKRKKLINAMIILGSIIAIYFLYVQAFILNSYCEWCLIVDFSMLFSLAIIIFNQE